MIRAEIKDNIYIDDEFMRYFSSDEYGYDQAYVSFPIVFPTVRLQLASTKGLDAIADELRKAEGDLPFFDDTGDYDDIGWYDFFIDLNGYNDHHVDTCIYARAYDDSDEYYIDLTSDEQEYIYQALSKEIDCEKLLKECADYWKDSRGELTILDRRTV